MFNDQVRPLAVDLVQRKVPADTDEEVKQQLVDDLCVRMNDLLVRGLTETFTDEELAQFEKALDDESAEAVQQMLMLPKVQTMIRDVIVGFTSSYTQTPA